MWLVGVLLLSLLNNVKAYGSGAPPVVCGSMEPNHKSSPQTRIPPYTITADANGKDFDVIIRAEPGNFFQGFFIQAREDNNRKQIVNGMFSEAENSKHVNCNNIKGNALTHKSKDNKTEIITKWTPPFGYEGRIIFRSTIVKTVPEYWIEVDTQPLTVSRVDRNDVDIPSTTTSTAMNEDSPQLKRNGRCGIEKACFGLPSQCEQGSDCEVLLSYVYDVLSSSVQFEISGKVSSDSDGYIAAGISTGAFMGPASVFDCSLINGKPSYHYSWNERRSNTIEKAVDGIQGLDATFEDGTLTCRWKRSTMTIERTIMFNLLNTTYYILLAKGSMKSTSPIVKAHHDKRLLSSSEANFTSLALISGGNNSSASIKAHGSLMVISWIGLVSIGILLARHYKDVWDEKTLCGVKIWFAFHRGLMLTSVSLMIVAFIIIFVYVGEWSATAQTHAIFGCIATAFAILQPVGALFRPDPKHPKRPIFNWMHWAGGNIGQILAVIAIFLAVKLPAANLPNAFYYVLAIFVAYHVLFNILIQAYIWQLEKKRSNEINMMELSNGKISETKSPGDKFKKTMLAIYMFPVLGLVVTLVFIISLR